MSDRAIFSRLQDRLSVAKAEQDCLQNNTFKEKKNVGQQQLERGLKICKRKNSAESNVGEEEGCASGPRAEISLQPVVR